MNCSDCGNPIVGNTAYKNSKQVCQNCFSKDKMFNKNHSYVKWVMERKEELR